MFSTSAEREVVRDILRRILCYVPLDFEEEFRITTAVRTRSSSLEKNYDLLEG